MSIVFNIYRKFQTVNVPLPATLILCCEFSLESNCNYNYDW